MIVKIKKNKKKNRLTDNNLLANFFFFFFCLLDSLLMIKSNVKKSINYGDADDNDVGFFFPFESSSNG